MINRCIALSANICLYLLPPPCFPNAESSIGACPASRKTSINESEDARKAWGLQMGKMEKHRSIECTFLPPQPEDIDQHGDVNEAQPSRENKMECPSTVRES